MLCAMKPVFVFILVGIGFVYGNDADLDIIDGIEFERTCLEAGGLCTIADDCPAGQLLAERGLCPKQQSQGVECCYELSVKETRCLKHGGICVSLADTPCRLRYILNGATDCAKHERCCVMIFRD